MKIRLFQNQSNQNVMVDVTMSIQAVVGARGLSEINYSRNSKRRRQVVAKVSFGAIKLKKYLSSKSFMKNEFDIFQICNCEYDY